MWPTRPFLVFSSLAFVLFCVCASLLGGMLPAHAASPAFATRGLALFSAPIHELNKAPYQQMPTIHIPGTPASNWCYDTATINDGTYYLADNDRAGIDLIRTGNYPAYQGIIGKGHFTGIGGCKTWNYDTDGPNGLVIAHDQIFAGDGNSSVRVYNTNTGKFVTSIPTHGHLRADEGTYDARDQMVVMANSSERAFAKNAAPFLSFISTRKGPTYDHVVKTLTFSHADSLEQPAWDASNGLIYLAVPASDQNPTGEVDVINPTTWAVTSIATPNCTDAGVAIANRAVIAVGCASGDQIVLNAQTHHLTRIPVSNVDIVAASQRYLFYASYGSDTQAPELAITDLTGHVLQTIKTSGASHTVTVDPESEQVFVPLDGGNIMVLRPRCRRDA